MTSTINIQACPTPLMWFGTATPSPPAPDQMKITEEGDMTLTEEGDMKIVE